jgi:hypothetical protein
MAAIDYQSLYQRPQHIASGLVKRGFPVYFRNVGQVGGREPVVIEGVNIYQDWDKRPEGIDNNSIYIIYYPAYAQYYNWNDRTFLIYDCVDDFPDMNQYEDYASRVSNLIVCTTKNLLDKFKSYNKEKVIISNGVDINDLPVDVNTEISSLKTKYDKVIGFVGALHFSWVDINLLYKVAELNPNWAVVIVGHSYTWNFNNPKAPDNLIRLGTKPYNELKNYYAEFDIGIIPFLDNQISRGSNPIKLYEYASFGIPIVGTDIFSDIGEPILYSYPAGNYNECIRFINKAIDENNKNNVQQRINFAKDNSWDKKIDLLLDKISTMTYLEN